MLTAAVAVLADEPGPDTVLAMSQLAAVYSISGLEESGDIIDRALQLAQRLGADDSLLANLFNSRGIALGTRGRQREAIAHFRESLRLAQASGSVVESISPTSNLGDSIMCDDPHQGLEYALRGQDQARQIGARYALGVSLLNEVLCLLRIGEWDRAATSVDGAIDDDDLGALADVARAATVVWALRGDPARAREIVPADDGDERLDPQEVAYHAYAHAVVCAAEGDAAAALTQAKRAAEVLPVPTMDPFVLAWPLAARLAHELGDREALDGVLALLDGYYPGEIPAHGPGGVSPRHGSDGRGPRGAGGRHRGRRDGPAGGRVAVPRGPRPARPRRGAAGRGQGPVGRHRRGGDDRGDAGIASGDGAGGVAQASAARRRAHSTLSSTLATSGSSSRIGWKDHDGIEIVVISVSACTVADRG